MKFSPSQKLNVSMLVLVFAIIFVPKFSFAASTVVIDEFRVDGPAGNKDEYVIIANCSALTIDLNQYAFTIKTNNTNYQYLYRFGAGSQIRANEKVKICHNFMMVDTSCNLFYTISATSDYEMKMDGVLALINVANAKENVDVVGYGKVPYEESACWATGCEKYPLDSPAKNTPYKRINGQDTNNSSQDFEAIVTPIFIDLNADKLVISELLPNPETGSEWFELYNPTNLSIGLANLKICDALGARHCYFFNEAEIIPANSYKAFTQSTTKITLNNDGDWLELYDASDNLITDTGGDYGVADKGLSLALFGAEYQWTKTPTEGSQNIFTDTIEVESDTALPTPKTTKAKVAVAKKTIAASPTNAPADSTTADEAVKAAETAKSAESATITPVTRKVLGWALIWLAILLILGYIGWYFRSYAKNIYDKIRHRDDSARF